MTHELKLYHYWRSSSSWRVRWALEIKKIKYESIAVNLLKKEQQSAEYIAKNASGFVPCLEINGQPFGESLAIIEWLEEQYPEPSLLPKDRHERLKVRQLALIIAAGTQPLQNLAAQVYYSPDKEKRKEYAQHWINAGFASYEATMSATSNYSFGNTITLADLCLLPQCYNALRFGVELEKYPNIFRVYNNCIELESYQNSHPDKQPGAVV
ncbi:maleylacetoacetate isomerase [Candidatus Uabimicrobium amorphum]|uniref:Maleylacetoacetate isomerase n=1 Tax=Uabimicrobium amorphum TaxID=2596890 RepID=A0A5S9F4S7_UABAM|nr:maleylacetoacetate isomerase [Candidatus Uabimicrobium amorphum]BBM85868.1 maleylacetoacetate isomerase [Candidatus Uabimicrobium amorphum]